MSSCCRRATRARKDGPCTKTRAPPARLRPRPASSCAVRSAACSRPRRSASRVVRRAVYDATTSAAKSTAHTIAAVLTKTRPAIPAPGDGSKPDLRSGESVAVIPNERVWSAELVQVRGFDIRARVDHERQRVDPGFGNNDLSRHLARAVLVPGVNDVAAGQHSAQREVARFVRPRRPRRWHGDDEAHHHRVNVAIDGINAGPRESPSPRYAASIQAEVEWPEVDVREDVVAEGILVRKRHAAAGEHNRHVRLELASVHRDHAGAHARHVVHRNGALARLEIYDGAADVPPLPPRSLLESKHAGDGSLRAERSHRKKERRSQQKSFPSDMHLLKLESKDEVEVSRAVDVIRVARVQVSIL